ncbi:uncharacterized protein PGTG_13582 [Puccinia graminis f. sp. tritici CRL 75-36-700-3]|uniref:Uncharacterized protein n=1 Tax=Puccinia graminis f. sp. tritici (strain CRL 75-36-700-3 / race SCCL) TaxID=418459 RepID=E3KSW8_PUCGT|nr:uncharacterized protein PGTG_13582 [Puccinia graminis f. sp. tritici CRL 75-36-700-3]EFP87354.1 hypothetical protein PGTG_13582 [Puccinia graminis f. sp. tritici CRL 75-36-700-3]
MEIPILQESIPLFFTCCLTQPSSQRGRPLQHPSPSSSIHPEKKVLAAPLFKFKPSVLINNSPPPPTCPHPCPSKSPPMAHGLEETSQHSRPGGILPVLKTRRNPSRLQGLKGLEGHGLLSQLSSAFSITCVRGWIPPRHQDHKVLTTDYGVSKAWRLLVFETVKASKAGRFPPGHQGHSSLKGLEVKLLALQARVKQHPSDLDTAYWTKLTNWNCRMPPGPPVWSPHRVNLMIQLTPPTRSC